MYETFEQERLIDGMIVTLQLSAACLVFSILIGIIGAWLQDSPFKMLRWIVQGYISFFRNTPPMVQLMFFYFGLGPYTPAVDMGGWQEPIIGSVGWAIIALSFFAGAFNVEIFRSGIEAVPDSTQEAADSLGFSRWQSYVYVVFPLALRVSLPALGNNIVNLVKTTTQAFVIAVPEVLYVSAQMWSDNVNVLEMMITLFACFIIVVWLIVFSMNRWERSLAVPGYGTRG
jgi:polar amino acid transport system permease protein